MFHILQISRNLLNNNNVVRITASAISTTAPKPLKQIIEKQEGNSLVIDAVHVESDRSKKMIKEACAPKFCPECTLGLNIKHTDVMILSQYVRSDGCMLPRRITGLCHRQQKRIGTLVTMAQKAGLMPNIGPANSKGDPKRRTGWKKHNKYFYEETIRY